MTAAYIVEARRTAGGKRGGALRDWHPADLGAAVLNALVERPDRVAPQSWKRTSGAHEELRRTGSNECVRGTGEASQERCFESPIGVSWRVPR